MSGECDNCGEHTLECRCHDESLYECCLCFCQFASNKPAAACSFCEGRQYYPDSMRLERILKVMDSARASRLPETLRLMYSVIKQHTGDYD